MQKNILIVLALGLLLHSAGKARNNSLNRTNDGPTRTIAEANKLLNKANLSENITEVQNILEQLKQLKPRSDWQIKQVEKRLNALEQSQGTFSVHPSRASSNQIPPQPDFPPPAPPTQSEQLTKEELKALEEFEEKLNNNNEKEKKERILTRRQRAEQESERKLQEAQLRKATREALASQQAKEELDLLLQRAHQYQFEEPIEATKLKMVFATRQQTPSSHDWTFWKKYYLPAAAHQALNEWFATETVRRLSYLKQLALDQRQAYVIKPKSTEYNAWTEIIDIIDSTLKQKKS